MFLCICFEASRVWFEMALAKEVPKRFWFNSRLRTNSSGVDDLSFEKWHSRRNSNQAKHLPILSQVFTAVKNGQNWPNHILVGIYWVSWKIGWFQDVASLASISFRGIPGHVWLPEGIVILSRYIMHSSAAVLRLQTPYQVRHLPKWSAFFSAKLGQERNGDGSKPWYLSPSGQEPCSHLSSIH